MISIAHQFYCGWGVYCIDCSCVSYVRLINQCGLHMDKIKILKKISGCGLYTGALSRSKITVSQENPWFIFAVICSSVIRCELCSRDF